MEILGALTTCIEITSAISSVVEDIQRRHKHIQQNPISFLALKNSIMHSFSLLENSRGIFKDTKDIVSPHLADSLKSHVSTIKGKLLEIASGTLELSKRFPTEEDTLSHRDDLQVLQTCTEQLSQQASSQPGASSHNINIFRRIRSKFKNMLNSNEIADEITTLAEETSMLSSELLTWINCLGNKVAQLQPQAPASGKFVPSFVSVPRFRNRHEIVLEFDNPYTVEGKLKDTLMEVVKSGKRLDNPVCGLWGLGGVGKTTALIGIARDPQVRAAFQHGIYFLSIGKDAYSADVIKKLSEFVHDSGGTAESREILGLGNNVQRAVSRTALWFEGRRVLFVCDDIWNNKESTLGHLSALRGLLDYSDYSHMVIASRREAIAAEADLLLRAQPLAPFHPFARSIFLKNANITEEQLPRDNRTSEGCIHRVLEECKGVPLILCVAGRAVRALTRRGDCTEALQSYIETFERDPARLFEERYDDALDFHSTIAASLDIADRSWKYGQPSTDTNKISTIFIRLSVLQNQAQVELGVLYRIWFMRDEKDVARIADELVDLCLITGDVIRAQKRFGLHDVILEYCRRRAVSDKVFVQFHRQFLNQFLTCESSSAAMESPNLLGGNGNRIAHRRWWEVSESCDGYLFSNLSRHLIEGGLIGELIGLLTHMGWTKLRAQQGGLSALNKDFDRALRCDLVREFSLSDAIPYQVLSSQLRQIHDACNSFWGIITNNPTELATQAFSKLPKSRSVLMRYLGTAQVLMKGTWLRPQTNYWPVDEEDQDRGLIQTGVMDCEMAVHFESGQAVFAGVDELVWVDIDERKVSKIQEITEICTDPGKPDSARRVTLTCVAFSSNGKRVLIGTGSGTIHIMDAATKKRVGDPLRAHESEKKAIRTVSCNCDGSRVLSISFDNRITVWEHRHGQFVRDEWMTKMDMDENVLAVSDGYRIVSVYREGTNRILVVRQGSSFKARKRNVGAKRVFSASGDGKVVICLTGTCRCEVLDVSTGDTKGKPLVGDSVVMAWLDGRGKFAVTEEKTSNLKIWNLETSTVLGGIRYGERPGGVRTVAINENCQRIALLFNFQNELHVFDTRTRKFFGADQLTEKDSRMMVSNHSTLSGNNEWTVQYSQWHLGERTREDREPLIWIRNNRHAFPDSNSSSRMMTPHSMWTPHSLRFPAGTVFSAGTSRRTLEAIAVSSDGRYVGCIDKYGSILLKKIHTVSTSSEGRGEFIPRLPGGDSAHVIEGSPQIVNETFQGRHSLNTQKQIAMSKDGTTLTASFSDDKAGSMVTLMSVAREAPASKRLSKRLGGGFANVRAGAPRIVNETFQGRHILNTQKQIAMSKDGTTLTTSFSDDKAGSVITVMSAACATLASKRLSKQEGRLTHLEMSSDGKMVMARFTCEDSQRVKIWDSSFERELWNSENDATCVNMSQDGKWMVYGFPTGHVTVADIKSKKLIACPVEKHYGSVLCVAISVDKQWIVSSASDSTLRLWKMCGRSQNAHENREKLRMKSISVTLPMVAHLVGVISTAREAGDRKGIVYAELGGKLAHKDIFLDIVCSESETAPCQAEEL